MEKESQLKQSKPHVRRVSRAAIVVALIVAVGAVAYLKRERRNRRGEERTYTPESFADARRDANPRDASAPQRTDNPLPRLVDLGAGKCIPCKMMAPILEELKEEYKGQFDVVFIDVWEKKAAGDQYGIRMIPTQIFFDAEGRELFRHEGFFSKGDILGKWKELGIDLGSSPQ
jgi:thioredoxin 1